MTPQKIIAGNWKMNGDHSFTEKLLRDLLKEYKPQANLTVVVCPPFTSLPVAAQILEDSKIELGAQDLSEHKSGAFTGDISAEMLKEIGVKYAIIGHSERRQYHHETDSLVRAKTQRAIETGLIPIICVGESLEQRENNETEKIVTSQLEGAIENLDGAELGNIVVAYEPIWAIGTGRTASPEMAREVHEIIRKKLVEKEPSKGRVVPIIYGGSVKPDNASGLFALPEIDGALVGGASLEAGSFLSILDSAK